MAGRLGTLLAALRHRRTRADPAALDVLSPPIVARELSAVREELSRLRAGVDEAQRRTERLLALRQREVQEQVALAGFAGAKLLSDGVVLDGTPAQRLRVRRRVVGEPVHRRFSAWAGITRCATAAGDVRELWERLLAFESGCSDDLLHGRPSTVLDIPDALVSSGDPRTLRVSLRRPRGQAASSEPVVAVPRFTYAFPPRKIRNVGHWLLDCVPQVVALSAAAPDAVFLLPQGLKAVHESMLSWAGVGSRQLVPWDGAPVDCGRLLVFESDGRIGGGRPLSALMELRRLLAAGAHEPDTARTRRIYVSRRDARARRCWVANEAEVEAVFRSRGFEIVAMAECPLDEQARIFRTARVVAGISGAGLADLVFSAPGTHAIVLLSDSLIRWYADQRGARSLWAGGTRAGGEHLAALGDSPRFYAHLAAALEQFYHSFVGGDQMPLEPLGEFVDDVLGRVDGA